MTEEPEKKYVLITEAVKRARFSCRLSPYTLCFLKSLAKTRETSLGRALDYMVKAHVETRELHERIKEHKKTLQFLKRHGKGNGS